MFLAGFLGFVYAMIEIALFDSAESPWPLTSGLSGMIAGSALLVVVGVWRGAREGLGRALQVMYRPPLWLYSGGLLIISVAMALWGLEGESRQAFAGLLGGYLLVGTVMMIMWGAYLTLRIGRRVYSLGLRDRYWGGVVTVLALSSIFAFGTLWLISGIMQKIAESESFAEFVERQSDEPEAQMMGIFSVGGDPVNERREACFQELADESSEIFKQGRWKAYRRLRSEDDALDAVYFTILRVCQAHGKSEKRNLESYFHASLTNQLSDFETLRIRDSEVCSIELPDQRSYSTPDVVYERARKMKDVQDIVCRLPEDQRNALKLHVTGHTHAEIARKLNVSTTNSRKLVSRAYTAVREGYDRLH